MAQTTVVLPGERKRRPVLGQLQAAWEFIRRWPVIPAAILITLAAAAILAPWIAPNSTRAGGIRDRHIPPAWTEEGTMEHIFGTDHIGRDVFSRVIVGARISMMVAAISVASGFLIGTTLGLVSGYSGGIIDELVTRIVDIFHALPFLMVALVCVMIFGQSLILVLALLALLAWVAFVRVVRSQTILLRSMDYVALARVVGASHFRIMYRHLLPGVINTAIVIATLNVGTLILAGATLSFLGAGVPPPTPAWGIMVAEASNHLTTAWWPAVFPGIAIFAVVMSLNFLGDWVRDRLDPMLRQID